MDRVDVVISYYRQAKHWPIVLQGLRENRRYINKVIVVNDEPWDGVELADGGFRLEKLDHVHDGFGVCRSFNQGVRAATTKHVILTSADCVMPPGFLRPKLALVGDNKLIGCPVTHINADLSYPDPVVLRRDSYEHLRHDKDVRPWRYVRGAFKLVDREAYLAMGGFDERYNERNYEDWDFTARWCSAYGDASVAYDSSVPIWHLGDAPKETKVVEPPARSLELLNATLRRYEAARLSHFGELVVDFDDLCDNTADTLDMVGDLKIKYPTFKCTLFAIPKRCSPYLIAKATKLDEDLGKICDTGAWLQLAPHGWRHTRGECLAWTAEEAIIKINLAKKMGITAPLFKAPAWMLDAEVYSACRTLGYTVYNPGHLGIDNYVHGHLSRTTGNYIGDMMKDGRLEFSAEHRFLWPQEMPQCVS